MDDERSVAAVAALEEPVRRRLYALVSEHDEPVSRDTAAAALGLARSVAAFHLDRLAELGLLDVEFRRPPGRSGPGAGRPAKLYRRSVDEIVVTLPERHYDLAAALMARAIDAASDDPASVRQTLTEAARQHGRALGERIGTDGPPLADRASTGSWPRRGTSPGLLGARSRWPTARSTPWRTSTGTSCAR